MIIGLPFVLLLMLLGPQNPPGSSLPIFAPPASPKEGRVCCSFFFSACLANLQLNPRWALAPGLCFSARRGRRWDGSQSLLLLWRKETACRQERKPWALLMAFLFSTYEHYHFHFSALQLIWWEKIERLISLYKSSCYLHWFFLPAQGTNFLQPMSHSISRKRI